MPKFSSNSQRILDTCDMSLIVLFATVVVGFDCTVFSGHRSREEQDELFRQGKSQLKFPASMHNRTPSLAVDVAAYPIDWGDRERATYFAGYVMGIAAEMKIPLRWGGDWDRDTELSNNAFDDLFHFELKEI